MPNTALHRCSRMQLTLVKITGSCPDTMVLWYWRVGDELESKVCSHREFLFFMRGKLCFLSEIKKRAILFFSPHPHQQKKGCVASALGVDAHRWSWCVVQKKGGIEEPSVAQKEAMWSAVQGVECCVHLLNSVWVPPTVRTLFEEMEIPNKTLGVLRGGGSDSVLRLCRYFPEKH